MSVKVVASASLSSNYDMRFVVVDEATGEVLDDAQMKDGEKVSVTDVRALLTEHGLELPFPVEDLMKHW